MLDAAAKCGPLGRFKIYAKLSGPGWLQGAITLGGGSLAGSLFIGILAGPHLLWIQAFAMMCGITMLSAIARSRSCLRVRSVELSGGTSVSSLCRD